MSAPILPDTYYPELSGVVLRVIAFKPNGETLGHYTLSATAAGVIETKESHNGEATLAAHIKLVNAQMNQAGEIEKKLEAIKAAQPPAADISTSGAPIAPSSDELLAQLVASGLDIERAQAIAANVVKMRGGA